MLVHNEAVFIPSPRAIWRAVDGEAVVLELDAGSYFGLNAIATRAWELMCSGMTQTGIVTALEAEYDAPQAQIDADIGRLLCDLLSHGLIVERHEPA